MTAAAFLGFKAVSAEVSDLKGVCRNGQVFLQWNEKDLPANARLSVWSSDKPLNAANLKNARKEASMLNPQSARDWWLDISSFVIPRSQKAKSEEIFAGDVASEKDKRKAAAGFVIEEGGKPIDPAGGLHVHTPAPGEKGKRYFAVTVHKGTSEAVICSAVTAIPVDVTAGKVQPIRISGKKLTANCAKGLPLFLSLHGRGGGAGVDARGNARGTHLLFAPRSIAWREGIPFKFQLDVLKDRVVLTLFDRIWMGRIMSRAECADLRDMVPAIATFWMGYNPDIAVSLKGPKFRFDNYTERYILFVIDWVHDFLGTDVNRTYIQGGSMGGTGGVQLATHFPERFAAVQAAVPIYAFTWKQMGKTRGSAWRMTCSAGKFTEKNPALMPDGRNLVDYADGARNIANSAVDMPPIFATNGRQDKSIPWINNPPFFAAANKAKQFVSVFWNNGNHGMSSAAPKDMQIGPQELLKFRLNESFPVFSNFTDNRNCGNGDPTDGDITGWINRGINWKLIQDTPKRYEIDLIASHPDIKYPVTASVTLRRRQNFRFAPGTEVAFECGAVKGKVKISKEGLLTIPDVRFDSKAPVRLTISK